MVAQSSILAEDQASGLYLTLDIQPNQDIAEIVSLCASLPQKLQHIRRSYNANHLFATLGLGYNVCQTIWGDSMPQGMRVFEGVKGKIPATSGDLFFHIHSNRADLNYELMSQQLNELHGAYTINDETITTRYLDNRDLTGFIDGTENPEGDDERSKVALLTDDNFKDGSFVFVQKYQHQLEQWLKLDTPAKENVIGRTMPDSVELDDKKENAHISRVVIEENGEELEIIRHSMPYLSLGQQKGLVFLAYTNDLNHIEKMLNRMYGFAPDGATDALLQYTKPLTGAMFFAPSLETLNTLIICNKRADQ